MDELLANGIEPFPTLFHWDLPQWVQDAGGWADRAVIGSFADYADAVVRALGDRIATWAVLNEPEVVVNQGHEIGDHAPGFRERGPRAARESHREPRPCRGGARRARRGPAGPRSGPPSTWT